MKKNYSFIEGWISIIGNVILFVLKYWAGIVTGSIALIADAWHTLTDSVSSMVVIISAYISKKPADKDHPFGHGRADLVSSIIIGMLLIMIGFEFILKSIEQLKSGTAVHFGTLALVVTLISILIKEGMAQYAFWAARKTNSPILKADGWHHRTDALSSVVVLIGIILGRFYWWIDGLLGIIVALLIFYAAYQILKESIDRLMGEIPDDKLILQINKITRDLHMDVCPHHFHMHKYGDHIEMTFHILLPPHITLEEAHRNANTIEETIREHMNIEATIHMEPNNKPDLIKHLREKQ
ncbi:MAG: cation diffusion facilitator family transporter [Salinivirgaceae bacterium]